MGEPLSTEATDALTAVRVLAEHFGAVVAERDRWRSEAQRLSTVIASETVNLGAYVHRNCGPLLRLRAALADPTPSSEES